MVFSCAWNSTKKHNPNQRRHFWWTTYFPQDFNPSVNMDAAEWKHGLTGDRQAKLRRAHFCPKESLSTMALTDMIRLPLLSEWERWPEHSAQNDEASDAMVRMTGSHSLLLLFLFSDFLPLVKIRDKSLVQPQEKIRKKLPTAELRQEGSKSIFTSVLSTICKAKRIEV